MKQINTIVQAVLALAVLVLFILHFSAPRDHHSTFSGSASEEFSEFPIAYVNIDSLVQNMEMWKDLQAKLNEKQVQFDNEISNKQKSIQNKANDLNNKIQKVLITRADAEAAGQQISIEQQDLINLADNYRMQLAEQDQVANRQVLAEIMEYLKEFNKDRKYQYILANSFGSQLLYSNEAFDITQPVLDGLNTRYRTTKK